MKKSYDTIEEAYKELRGPLIKYAQKHLAQKEDAEDAVQEAFVKGLKYMDKGTSGPRSLNKFLLFRETARACRRLNQSRKESTAPECVLVRLEGALNSNGKTSAKIFKNSWPEES